MYEADAPDRGEAWRGLQPAPHNALRDAKRQEVFISLSTKACVSYPPIVHVAIVAAHVVANS